MSQLLNALRAEPVGTIRTAVWAARAIPAARRGVRRDASGSHALPPAPRVAPEAEAAMLAALRLSRDKCLVTAVVRQSWMHAQGDDRDLVIGVRRASGDFQAHAWLEGDAPGSRVGFQEIARRRHGESLRKDAGLPYVD